GRILELALRRHRQQLVVGNAAPQEDRQARRQLEIGKPVRSARFDTLRVTFDLEQEVDVDQQPLDRGLNARLERALGTALALQAEERIDLRGRGGAALAAGAA